MPRRDMTVRDELGGTAMKRWGTHATGSTHRDVRL